MSYGDVRDLLDPGRLVCTSCGRELQLNLDRWGLDWPDVLEGWQAVERTQSLEVAAICPSCTT